FNPRVWLDFSDPKWDRARNQLQGLVNHCLDPSLQRRRSGLSSYREQIGHYHSDVSLRVRTRPASRKLQIRSHPDHAKIDHPLARVCFPLTLRVVKTFLRDGLLPIGGFRPCLPLALRVAKSVPSGVRWLAFGLRTPFSFVRLLGSSKSVLLHDSIHRVRSFSSLLFARFLGSSASDVSPIVRAFSRSAGKFLFAQQFTLRTFSRVIDGRRESQSASFFEVVDERRESQSASFFEVCWQIFVCTAVYSSHIFSGRGQVTSLFFARFLGSSTSDVSPRVRAFSRSAGKFLFAQQFILRTFSRVIDERCESQSASFFEFTLRTFSRVVDGRRESQSASFFEVYWQVFVCTAVYSSHVFSGRRRAT
ncbi:hypothetical protein PanWU01x14_121350, partial [Parasponia andersonii]